jgi:hypothetical protein
MSPMQDVCQPGTSGLLWYCCNRVRRYEYAVKFALGRQPPFFRVRRVGRTGLVGALPQGGKRDAAVERAGAFFPDDSVQAVRRVAVLGHVERVGHGVVLCLQADLDDLHGRHDSDGLGDAGREAGWGS